MSPKNETGSPGAGRDAEASGLDFVLSQADGRPMYVQLMDEVQRRIAVGDWAPGAQLPSIRQLAVATRVSVITVKRAYLELEREGVIVTQQGKGSFVGPNADPAALQAEELERHLGHVVALARTLGIDTDELKKRLDRVVRDLGRGRR